MFSDGSLGLPEPGAMYTMNCPGGFIVPLTVRGEAYEYRFEEGCPQNGLFADMTERPSTPMDTWTGYWIPNEKTGIYQKEMA